jgi:hypothetical protein
MSDETLYQRILGDGFDRLAPEVQAFHRLQGRHVLHGAVETRGPRTPAARLIGRCLGTPMQTTSGPLHFEIDAAPDRETWTRHFPTQSMTSTLRLQSGTMVEDLGAATLSYDLVEVNGRLTMKLRQLTFFALPCPDWLRPQVITEERGDGGRYCFKVEASVPGVGLVVAYEGHLELPKA